MKIALPKELSLPLFQDISPSEQEKLLCCLEASERRYEKGTFLLHAGETADRLGVLLEGSASVLQEDYWGNRNLITHLGAGQVFAESFALLPGTPLNVSVLAQEACRVLLLPTQRILSPCPSACAYHGRLTQNLLRELARKNLRLNEKLTHMGQRSTREKLLSFLSAEAGRKGAAEFEIRLDRQQLADYLGVERSAMCAVLTQLQKEGLLAYNRKHFRLFAGSPSVK